MPDRPIPDDYKTTLERRGFHIEGWHGGGGFGNVYKALQVGLNRHVAIKFFDNKFSMMNPVNRKRFEREAPLLARIQHPSVPFVITHGVVGEGSRSTPYTVMQFIAGDTLDARIEGTPRPFDASEIWRVMSDVLGALDAVHQHDIVHRDVKPDNIILSPYGTYLVDFSIGISLVHEPGVTRATAAETRIGTAKYMAPEQYKDSSTVTHLADVYSAGAVLAELLGAQLGLRLGTLDTELKGVPKVLRDVIRRACADTPEDRFATAKEFRAELARVLGVEGVPVKPPADPDLLEDHEVAVLAVVLAECPFPGDDVARYVLLEKIQPLLPDVQRALGIRRLLRLGLIEAFTSQSHQGDDYDAVRLTEEGHRWAAEHHDWVTTALGTVRAAARALVDRAAERRAAGRRPAAEPAPASNPADDDIPF